MTEVQMTNEGRKYDLEERTALFGEAIIEFVKMLPNNPINNPLISQIVRAGTSVGQIIWRQMELSLRRISSIKFLFVKKRARKQNTGYA